jgi:hypothetical protein
LGLGVGQVADGSNLLLFAAVQSFLGGLQGAGGVGNFLFSERNFFIAGLLLSGE